MLLIRPLALLLPVLKYELDEDDDDDDDDEDADDEDDSEDGEDDVPIELDV